MNDLLANVLEAHGGLHQWKRFNKIQVRMVSRGQLFEDSTPDDFSSHDSPSHDSPADVSPRNDSPREMTAHLHEQRALIQPFGAPDRKADFTPHRIAIETTDGRTLYERTGSPRALYQHMTAGKWDLLDRAWFNGYAMWNSLTAPFFLAMPGVSVIEIEPWRENDLVWRGLSVSFPPDIVSHSSIQDFYFGSDYLLRRHDCTMHLAGAFDTVQYVFDPVEVEGIQIPIKRRIFRRGPDRRPVWDELVGAVELSDIRFS